MSKLPKNVSDRILRCKAIVFDIDGVLLDSELYNRNQAFRLYYNYVIYPNAKKALKRDFNDDRQITTEIHQKIQKATKQAYGDPSRFYRFLLDKDELDEEFWQQHRIGVERLKSLIRPVDGAVELINLLSKKPSYEDGGVGISAWTSREERLVTPELCPGIVRTENKPRRQGYFDYIIHSNNVGCDNNGKKLLKPNPEGFRLLAHRYNLPFDQMVIIEDNPANLVPIKKMGGVTIGVVLSPISPPSIREEIYKIADLVIEDSLHPLIQLFQDKKQHHEHTYQ